MKVYKFKNKNGQRIFNRYLNNEGYSLSDVYGRCSEEKWSAWEYCLNWCNSMDGRNFHICSHNTFGFSVAWCTVDEDDMLDKVYVITPQSNYMVDMLS